ncbi:FixH family protein [Alicyclobacillus sp.]|uniref:FixH family protein n=1 Tax=Alicyclobacillus sp. TaxID=61169 RepID=UPI0025C64F71|nr:FixH family protein [Alicyclobacillus sp.]MCL6517034.1 FixH family protein [Alicyclobacillus sp.]
MLFSLAVGCGPSAPVVGQAQAGPIVVRVAASQLPLTAMADEQLSLSFVKENTVVDVNVSKVTVSMPDMAMQDVLPFHRDQSGEYQGNYRFSMSGDWQVEVTFSEGGKSYSARIPLHVS